MRIAVIGSRSIKDIKLDGFLPPCEEIITGGAVGIDRMAEQYARRMRIQLTVITPDYAHYGRAAPLVRDREIVDRADIIFAFWDGLSRGTKYVIDYSAKIGKPCKVQIISTFDNQSISKRKIRNSPEI